MSTDAKTEEQQKKVVELVHLAIERDEALREKYQIGDKFRFVREKLKQLLQQLESDFHVAHKEEITRHKKLQEGEVPVYVYLYNAKGVQLSTWVNLLTPKVFYEYSINRPIYTEKSHVEALLKNKTNIQQHAYLTVAMQPGDILPTTQNDINGNPTVRVKENSLRFDRLISFSNNGQDYILNEEGEFEKI